jgi:hypothetical protein
MTDVTVAERLRELILAELDPAVVAALVDGPYSGDEHSRCILMSEGLAKESGNSWLTWTPEGELLHSLLQAAKADMATKLQADKCDQPSEKAGKPTMADAVASLRTEAIARGGER